MARILVVDDETTIRLMIRMALEFVHHAVETASDGEEGLRIFGDGAGWDLVLLDQRMPGLEGIDVLRRMRERNPSARVMMVTAFGTIDLAYQAMRAGAMDFLRKPFTADMLRGAVEQALKAPAPMASESSRFRFTTLNGFRVLARAAEARTDSGVAHEFDITSPTGARRQVKVLLPSELIAVIEERTGSRRGPSTRVPAEMWWQLLSEEVLANYVWQHSDFPPAELRVEELTSGLRRWIDAILTEAG